MAHLHQPDFFRFSLSVRNGLSAIPAAPDSEKKKGNTHKKNDFRKSISHDFRHDIFVLSFCNLFSIKLQA
jgi:hypothetical protein